MIIYRLGDKQICLEEFSNGRGLNYLNVHEDEQTSIEAGKSIIKSVGGRFTQIISEGNQNISFRLNNKEHEFNPNRVFTRIGITRELNKKRGYSEICLNEIQGFSKFLLKHIGIEKYGVVALHNNRKEYNIQSYFSGKDLEQDAKDVFVNPFWSKRDFFFVTEEKAFYFLKHKKVNVVLQSPNVGDDGSLSVYCAQRDIPYINVEAGFGHLEQQIKMLEILQELI